FAEDRSALGLLESPALLGRKKSLVFLVSDYYFPLAILKRLLQALDRHDVVPVVLQDSREEWLPARGLMRLKDCESGRSRLLILRPGMRAKIQADFAKRRDALIQLCTQFGRAPHFVTDAFDPDRLTHYFFQ
ncbi:MAG: DUF58 domain-containing protein, partial [Methylococcales bacterium]